MKTKWLWWHFWLSFTVYIWPSLKQQDKDKGKQRCRSHYIQPPSLFIREDTVLAFMTLLRNKLKSRQQLLIHLHADSHALSCSTKFWFTVHEVIECVWCDVCTVLCLFIRGYPTFLGVYHSLWPRPLKLFHSRTEPDIRFKQFWSRAAPHDHLIEISVNSCFQYWSLFKWKSQTLIDDKKLNKTKKTSFSSHVLKCWYFSLHYK